SVSCNRTIKSPDISGYYNFIVDSIKKKNLIQIKGNLNVSQISLLYPSKYHIIYKYEEELKECLCFSIFYKRNSDIYFTLNDYPITYIQQFNEEDNFYTIFIPIVDGTFKVIEIVKGLDKDNTKPFIITLW